MRAQRAIAARMQVQQLNAALETDLSEDAIRLRSQEIWEREGRPEGHADEHWARARAELAEQVARMANAHLIRDAITPAPDARPEPAANTDTDIALPESDAPQTIEPAADIAENIPAVVEPAVSEAVAEEPAPAEIAAPVVEIPQPAAEQPVPEAPAADHVADIPSFTAWLLAPVRASDRPSMICGGVLLKGVLESPGDLHFDGRLEGDIRSPSLDIGADAVIEGEVVAGEMTVRGHVRGRIVAGKLLICTGARVEGEISYRTLTIEPGTQLDARFGRLQEA